MGYAAVAILNSPRAARTCTAQRQSAAIHAGGGSRKHDQSSAYSHQGPVAQRASVQITRQETSTRVGSLAKVLLRLLGQLPLNKYYSNVQCARSVIASSLDIQSTTPNCDGDLPTTSDADDGTQGVFNANPDLHVSWPLGRSGPRENKPGTATPIPSYLPHPPSTPGEAPFPFLTTKIGPSFSHRLM